MSFILGVSDTHNAAAASLDATGNLHGLQEERPTNMKNFSGFPRRCIVWLMQKGNIKPEDVDVVALAGKHAPPDRTREQTIAAYRNSTSFNARIKKLLRHTPLFAWHQNQLKGARISRLEDMGFRKEAIRFYEHHACHAATAYYGWGRYDEPVLIITCDGAGDGLCATVNIGKGGSITRLHGIDWGNSIARVYGTVTYLMGMVPLEHEYKMMGMAPYAKTQSVEKIANKLEELFEWNAEGKPEWHRRRNVPHMFYIKDTLQRLFVEERFDAVMGGAQLFVERMLKEFVTRAVASTGISQVALSGGIFMNVKANKEILSLDCVDNIWVMPSCGDETNAIGACYLGFADMGLYKDIPPVKGFYLGPEWDVEDLRKAAEIASNDGLVRVTEPNNINEKVVEMLVKGDVVARFSGAEEFGARSLGNRALLADPRYPEVVQVINEMIKNRDFWMPFATSVLDKYETRYIVNNKKTAAPYMILSFDTTTEGSNSIKAGIHPYDKTCRPQVVSSDFNPEYWDLINRFSIRTGVGALLNTSLNLHGLPLVHTPDDAIDILRRSSLKYLALGPLFLERIN